MTTINDVREYWDRRPCNIWHSLVDIDESPMIYSYQVTNRKYFVEPHIPLFAEFLRWDGCSVLELGCGIGTDTLSFAASGARVVAIDISEKSLEIARKRAWALKLGHRIEFICGNIEELDRALGSPLLCLGKFDLIYAFGVLHHTPHPEKALRQIRQYIPLGGILKIMLYHRYTPKVLSALVRHWRPGMSVDDAVAKMSEAQAGCPITHTYTKKSAVKLLCDFEILDMHVDHIFPYRIRDYVNYRHRYNWWWRWMPPRLFRWFESIFGWHLLITARNR